MLHKGLLLSLCLAGLAMVSCTNDEPASGTLSLRLTDAPTDAETIAGVYVTIEAVEYRYEDEWHSFEAFDGPKSLNLLDLTEGKTELLGDFEVPAGTYSELRFILNAATNGGSPASEATYIQFTNGTTEPLYVPSGTQSGYKAKGSFDVPVNGSVFITADFDVRKSVVQSGASGKWILKPVIRLVVNEQAGTIEGQVNGLQEGLQYVVYAYANDTYTDAEAALPSEGEPQFPNAVSSASVHVDGHFTLPFLAAGIYDLYVVAYQEGEFVEVADQLDNVEVKSLLTTPVRVDF
ncbi:DUF4382 domain-containing protein [Cesiribacter andamanensis]|uniref:DUF4382 domain-containing protein n=1 Tax=Cesiribacter andamanensis AMV16 TaxID=1279009 RepID=M7NKW9_9BACT|nr:DUF4382 domain-containing protein [Cesiribacter andamanensis]EMR02440.1 hypothetical protein ADICEAN_02426 [Cesiribacter andamanensis AMV16]